MARKVAAKEHLFPPGKSGNPRGRPKKLLKRVDEILHDADVHPLVKLMDVIPKLSPEQQAKTWLEILSYVQAKAKEETTDTAEPVVPVTLSPSQVAALKSIARGA